MSRFETTEDIRNFCQSLVQLAADIGDENVRFVLERALKAGDSTIPTERLIETINGLIAARDLMSTDDRYSNDVNREVDEAIKKGKKILRKANRPWEFWLFLMSLLLFP